MGKRSEDKVRGFSQPDRRKPVRIQIRKKGDGNEPALKVQVEGEWIRKGGQEYLRYHDPETGSMTTLKWDGEHRGIWIIRQGEVQSRQYFLPGEETYSVYHTPFGSFSLRTFTRLADMHVAEGTGCLHLQFVTQLNGGEELSHDLTLLICEADESKEGE